MIANDAAGLDDGLTDLREVRLLNGAVCVGRSFLTRANEEDELAVDLDRRECVLPLVDVDLGLNGRLFCLETRTLLRDFLR